MILASKQLEAAQLIAEDKLTDVVIAQRLEIDRATLSRWKNRPQFIERVEKIKEETAARLEEEGMRNKDYRLKRKQRRYALLEQLVNERAEDPDMKKVPGGTTGFLVKIEKTVVTRERTERTVEYRFDQAVFKSFSELERETAQELGQLTEKGDSVETNNNVIIYLPAKEPYPTLTPPPKQITDVIEHD